MADPGAEYHGRKRRARRAAEAHERADQAHERADEARDRLADLRTGQRRLMRPDDKPKGSTADQAHRAQTLAAESRRQARRSADNAATALRASAAVHDSAALLHDHLAETGFGDAEQHRQQAQRHRCAAQADRVEAQQDERLRDRFDQDLLAPTPVVVPTGRHRSGD
jgi:hypothetical protein